MNNYENKTNMVSSMDARIQSAIQFALQRLGYQSLKEGQRKVIEAYLNGKDVFFSSPTGSGKSLCFEIAPFVFDYIHELDSAVDCEKSICLVVAPLVSLMKDQVASLRKKGIEAINIGPETTPEKLNEIKDGKFSIVFGSPEALLNKHRSIFRGKLRDCVRVVFVDESHCIAKWGKGHGSEEAFRSDYIRLGELRSLLRKEVPFITLTATATDSTKKVIISNLCMKDCVEILANPDRPNTRYSVVVVDVDDLYSSFSWLIDQLEQHNVTTPKVIVFCRRKQHMKDLFELFSLCLGNKAYYMPTGKEPKDDRSRLFAMYHKMTDKLVKQTIEEEFCKPNGSVHVLFCSIAFGMGVNVRDIYLNLHLGPSGDLDDYLQETGRVGRDSSQMSHAVLLKFKGCTASKNITKDMKNYVNNDCLCRREILLKHFDFSVPKDRVLHECCDICAQECKCLCLCECTDNCNCSIKCLKDQYLSDMEKHLTVVGVNAMLKANEKINNVTQKGAVKLRGYLLAYRSELANCTSTENRLNLFTGIDIATGYSRSLIDNIVRNINYIKDKSYLKDNFSFFSDEHVEKTWEFIHLVLSSTDSDSNSDDDIHSDFYYAESPNDTESDNYSSSGNSSSNDAYRGRKQLCHVLTSSESSDSN